MASQNNIALINAHLELTMMGYAYFEAGVLPDGHGEYDPASAEAEASRRRAHYANDIWHEKIISCNLRVALVDKIARRYVNRGVALSDLIREGNLGLTHALENFETEGGSRFSTYATRCIRQNIERAIISQSGASRISAASNVTQTSAISDLRLHCQSISGRGVNTNHQSA